jgi:hypothetical protein
MGCGDWMYTSFLSGHEGFIHSPQANSNVPQSTESAADRKRQNGHGPPQPHRHINEGTKNQTTGTKNHAAGAYGTMQTSLCQPTITATLHGAVMPVRCVQRATPHGA